MTTAPAHIPEAPAARADDDVVIGGDVADARELSGSGDVTIAGTVEGATVTAGRDLRVAGGIASRGRGRASAGRDLACRFANYATLDAGRDVTIAFDVAHCHITCGGTLRLERGTIVAGTVRATAGVSCRSVGSALATETLLECGVIADVRARCAARVAQLDVLREAEREVRRQLDRLVPDDRHGQSTGDVAARAARLRDDLAARRAAFAAAHDAVRREFEHVDLLPPASVEVADTLHPGVLLRFPGAEATVTTAFVGPLKILCKTIRGARQVVLEAGPATIELETRQLLEDPLERVRRIVEAGRSE